MNWCSVQFTLCLTKTGSTPALTMVDSAAVTKARRDLESIVVAVRLVREVGECSGWFFSFSASLAFIEIHQVNFPCVREWFLLRPGLDVSRMTRLVANQNIIITAPHFPGDSEGRRFDTTLRVNSGCEPREGC